jgi:hypothetical protein
MVRKGGFEPPRLSAPPPQDGVSASSTTSARVRTINPEARKHYSKARIFSPDQPQEAGRDRARNHIGRDDPVRTSSGGTRSMTLKRKIPTSGTIGQKWGHPALILLVARGQEHLFGRRICVGIARRADKLVGLAHAIGPAPGASFRLPERAAELVGFSRFGERDG